MISKSDPRFIFFALLGISLVNCDPTTFASAPFSTEMDVEAYISRFRDARAFLTPKLAEFGYVADQVKSRIAEHDSGKETTKEVDLKSFRRFFMAEYAVAPAVILDELNHSVILGNFADEKAGLEYAEKHGLTILKNFGNGVFIFRKKVDTP